MDQLIVDLDKVLDDFEEDEEKAAALVPGQEPKPSGFAQYLKTHEESPWESLSHESVPNMISQKDSIDELSEKPGVIAYDMPYHVPHEFDMSEANFSLSLNKGQTSSQNVNQVVVKTESDLNYQNSLNAKYVSINDRIEEYECDNTGNKVIGQSSNNPDILEIPESKPYQETKPPGSLTFVPLELVEPTTANSLPCANLLNSIDITPTEISGDLNTCNAGKDNLQINKLESCEEDNCNEEVELSREILANGTEMDDVSFCKELTDRNTQLFKSSSHSWSPDSEQVVPSQLADNSLEISAGEITNDNVESVMQRSGGLETMNNTVSEEKTKQNSLQISERKNCNIIENLRANLLPDSTCINEDNDLAQVSSPDSAANHEKHKDVVGFSDVSDCIDEDLINDYLADDEIIGANLNVMNNGCNSELRCVEPHTVKYVQEEILEITQHTTKGTVANTQDESVNLPNGDLSENGEEEVIDAPTAEQKIGDDLDFADKVEQSALNNCPFTGNVGFSCELASDSDLPNQIYENTHCSQDSSAVFENGTDNSSPDSQQSTILGARPKELSQMKKNRPNSLLGLSKISLDTPFNSDITKVTIHGDTVASLQNGLPNSDPDSKQRVQQCLSPLQKKLINMEIKQRLEKEHKSEQYEETSSAAQESSTLNSIDSGTDDDTQTSNSEDSLVLRKKLENNQPMQSPIPVLQTQVSDSLVTSPSPARPHSWSPAGVGPSATQKQKRPTSLNLPPRQELNQQPDQLSPQTFPSDSDSLVESGWMQPGECETTGLDATQEVAPSTTHPAPTETSPQPLVLNQLGKIAPVWVPDSDAPNCMQCEARFTFTKRRHHCRACGKVFCSTCCSMKNKLQYMDNKEARVCLACHQLLNMGSQRKGEPKQVMFSDGIRPGGDLTEGDGPAESRLPPRRTGRVQKKVEKIPQGNDQSSSHRTRCLRSSDSPRNKCLIPETGLPPIVLSTGVKGDFAIEEDPDIEQILPKIKTEENDPVIFAINSNLFVMVKIIHLDCCVSRVSWCFTTKGLCTVGQEEIVIVLEYLEEEKNIPKDIFWHFHTVYDEAYKGNTVSDMGHTIFNQSFLGSRDHGGFLYIRPSFQCLQKLLLPSPPYLFGILLQKWEAPWAKVFPIRLLLRLGAEYRYYPCPLISVRNRKPVFFEIGHTIMNLLADFRNYQYMLPQIRGVTIHMEDKRTVINFPRNRYDDLMKVVNNSNEHVMALGAKFSPDADSHLVCIQNDDGNYQTQAINIQNKPRKVTGASFVVFNGALKTSSGLTAKSSIVEDGLMVQIMPESMAALKQAMKDMRNYTIGCGTVSTAKPEEVVLVQWVGDDKSVNIGVRSPVDKMSMDGVKSVHIHNSPDYVGDNHAVRWTEVFFIQNEDLNSSKLEPVDLSRLAETLAQACCIALTPHLDQLKEAALTKVGLRVTIEAERVGYEVGASGEKLPDFYMNDLDNELIPVIHNAASQSQDGPIILELIFYVLD